MSTHEDDEDLCLYSDDDRHEARLVTMTRHESRAHVKRLAAERLGREPTKHRETKAAPDLVHVDERNNLRHPPSMTPWRSTTPQETRMEIFSLPVELIDPHGLSEAPADLTGADLDHQAKITGEASAELNEEGLDHQAEITGEASAELDVESLDHQAEITGEASAELDVESLDHQAKITGEASAELDVESLDHQAEITGEASAELDEESLDDQAKITGEASAELDEEGLDHQAEITGEASAELDEEGLDALLWRQLGRGRRTRG